MEILFVINSWKLDLDIHLIFNMAAFKSRYGRRKS